MKKQYIKELIFYGLVIAGWVAIICFGVLNSEPAQQDILLTTPAPIVYVEPAEVVVIIEQEPVAISDYEGLEYLLEADVNRMIQASHRSGWARENITITQVSNHIWDVTVTFKNGRTETFAFNEKFGWH